MKEGRYINYSFEYKSHIGLITLASDGESITGLWIKGQKYFASTLDNENSQKDLAIFAQAKKWLDIYFNGQNPPFMPPLAPKGTVFRQAVWKILCDIPYGEVVSYSDIARLIAKILGKERMSARAIGGAVGHNPISIIIPCHRVIGANGSLTGYAGGLDIKTSLLKLENVQIKALCAS